MNRERRKQIAAARELIDKGKALLDEARDMLETIKDDEQAARENLPPALRTANARRRWTPQFPNWKARFQPLKTSTPTRSARNSTPPANRKD
ncbi:hypothetical protein ACFSTI_34000 [Rhizorhabdus histidinilytica]